MVDSHLNERFNQSLFLYHGFVVSWSPKKIPCPKGHDWDFWPENFDRDFIGDLLGDAANVEEAKHKIDLLIDGV